MKIEKHLLDSGLARRVVHKERKTSRTPGLALTDSPVVTTSPSSAGGEGFDLCLGS